MSCLEGNIVGLSELDCPCFNGDRPSDTDVSLSGLFLDEVIELGFLEKLENCNEGSMWELMMKQRKYAVAEVEEALIKGVKERAKINLPSCSQMIGGWKFKKEKTILKNYAGLKVTLFNIKGSSSIIRSVRGIFKNTGVLNAKIIFKNLDIEDVDFVLNTKGMVQAETKLEKELELHNYSNWCDNIEMFVVYEVSGDNPAMNNEVDCGCSRKINCYESFVQVKGIEGDDLEDIENWRTSDYANGLLLDMSFRCEEENVICDGAIDWKGSFGKNIARAIQFLTAFKLFEKMYYSTKASVWTTVSKEDLETMLPRLEEKYNEFIIEAIKGIDVSNSDCFACEDAWGIKHGAIG